MSTHWPQPPSSPLHFTSAVVQLINITDGHPCRPAHLDGNLEVLPIHKHLRNSFHAVLTRAIPVCEPRCVLSSMAQEELITHQREQRLGGVRTAAGSGQAWQSNAPAPASQATAGCLVPASSPVCESAMSATGKMGKAAVRSKQASAQQLPQFPCHPGG